METLIDFMNTISIKRNLHSKITKTLTQTYAVLQGEVSEKRQMKTKSTASESTIKKMEKRQLNKVQERL